MIRVDRAETQDYVSELPGLEERDEEEMEELSFIPRAVSEPRWALHTTNEEKRATSSTNLRPLEGGAARTINLCKQCKKGDD